MTGRSARPSGHEGTTGDRLAKMEAALDRLRELGHEGTVTLDIKDASALVEIAKAARGAVELLPVGYQARDILTAAFARLDSGAAEGDA